MGVFDRQITTAKRIIQAKGRRCIWRVVGNAPPADPLKPWKVPQAAPIDNMVTVVFLPETRAQFAFLQSIANDSVAVGDDYGLMAAVDFTPLADGELWSEDGAQLLRKVKSVDPLAPNGEVILYTLRFMVAA